MLLVFSILPATVLFLAVTGNWHHGLLNLKWVMTVSTAVILLDIRGRADWTWYVVFLALLVAFNPFVPIRPLVHVWVMVEIAAGICFIVSALVLWRA